jgi:hypothetical protein
MIPELEALHGDLVYGVPNNPTERHLAKAVCNAVNGDARVQRAKEVAWNQFSPTRMVLAYEALMRGAIDVGQS